MVKQWDNGDELTIEIQNNQLVISSAPNEGLERQMEIDIVTTNSGPTQASAKLIIKQIGNALIFETTDNKIFTTTDNKIFTVKKS